MNETHVGKAREIKMAGVQSGHILKGIVEAFGEPIFVHCGFAPTEIEVFNLGERNAVVDNVSRLLFSNGFQFDLGDSYANFNPLDVSLFSNVGGNVQNLVAVSNIPYSKDLPFGSDPAGKDIKFAGLFVEEGARGFWIGAIAGVQPAAATKTAQVYTLALDTPTGGTYELSDRGITKSLAHNADDAAILAAVKSIYGEDNVTSVSSGVITMDIRTGATAMKFESKLTSAPAATMTITTPYAFVKATVPNILSYKAIR